MKTELKRHWVLMQGREDGMYVSEPLAVAFIDLFSKEDSVFVWRIWNTKTNTWYISGKRSVWMTRAGALVALTLHTRSFRKSKDGYELKRFLLVEVTE